MKTNLDWVDFSHNGDASFAGVYQPPLPTNTSSIGGFIATSNFADVWKFLKLKETSPIRMVQERAKVICHMNMTELATYNANLTKPAHADEIHLLCFRSVFVFEMLYTGYGFDLDYRMQAVDVVNNQKLGWALGSILYEINTLPWDFAKHVKVVQMEQEEDVITAELVTTNPSSNKNNQVTSMSVTPLSTSITAAPTTLALLLVAIATLFFVKFVQSRRSQNRRRNGGYQEILDSP